MRNFVHILCACLTILAADAHSQAKPARVPADQWQQAERLAPAQPDEALSRFKRLLQGLADSTRVRSAAAVLRQAGALRQAEQLLLWAAGRMRTKAAFAPQLADLYQTQLRYDDAVHQLALAMENGANTAAASLEAVAVQTGFEKTAALLQRETLRRDESLRLRGDLWTRAGDLPRAWESYRDVGDVPLVGSLLTTLLQRDPPAEQAAGFIRSYLKRQPKDIGQWELRLAGYQLSLGENDDAQRLLEGLAGRGVFPAQYELSRYWLEQRHSPAESRRVMEQYARAWPGPLRVEGQFLTAAILEASGRADSALAVLSMLADTGIAAGIRQRAYFQMGEIEFARQNFDRAAELYDKVPNLGLSGDLVNDALAQLLLLSENKTDKMGQLKAWAAGRAAEQRLDFKQASETYRSLADSGGGLQGKAQVRLAQLAEQQRDFRDAARQYQLVGQSSSDTLLAAEALYRAGKLRLQRLSDPAAARQLWEQGIIKYPDTSWADLMRGELERLQHGHQP